MNMQCQCNVIKSSQHCKIKVFPKKAKIIITLLNAPVGYMSDIYDSQFILKNNLLKFPT